MRMRILVLAGITIFVIFGLWTWRKNAGPATPESGASMPPQAQEQTGESDPSAPMTMPTPDESQIGVAWTVPSKWLKQIGGGSMRFATYVVPGKDTNADAECAVYYFGPKQGGGVDANLDRWSSEFEKLEHQETKRREIAGLKVATIALTGTFSGHTMNPNDATGPKPNSGMLGAIVEGPNGDVFFKLTGPEETITSAKPAWESMLSSLHAKK